MAAFIRLVEQFAIVFYAACLVGIVWSIRAAWLHWREGSDTLFSLEQDAARTRAARSLMGALGFLALGLGVLLIAGYVAPSLPADATPAPTLSVPLLTPTPTNTPFPTPTPQNTPTPLPNPTVASVDKVTTPAASPAPTAPPAPICPDPNVQITAPGDGSVFSGPFQIFGTANIQNFGFYKFVLNGPATDNQDRTAGEVVKTPVVNGYLGTLDPSVLLQAPGTYRFSLVAVNTEGNEAPHCTITLRFLSPTPAPN